MMMTRAHSRVFAVTLLLLAMTLTGCFGTTPEDAGEQAIDDCEVDHCIEVTIDAIECPEGYDNMHDDEVCLAYNSQIPGPTWVFHEGDTVELTLVHNVTESIGLLDVDQRLAQRLSEARYSLHRHGLMLDACSDGVAQPDYLRAGVSGTVRTEICDSTVGPVESVSYIFQAGFPGYWHYHDHAHTFDAQPVHPPILGHEGTNRGLWGAFITIPVGERTDHVFDLHILRTGLRTDVNGGLGLDGTVGVGDRFDIIATDLGLFFWEVTLSDPSGATIGQVVIGPGVSRGLTVHDAEMGTYTWRAEVIDRWILDAIDWSGPLPGPFEGSMRATGNQDLAPDGESTDSSDGPPPHVGPDRSQGDMEIDQTFVLEWDIDGNKPLLEAYAGELLQFIVVTTGVQAAHTFHLHGHPWDDPETGEPIDTVNLFPGDTHSFTVIAGLEGGHSGDWLYHCHVDWHTNMWGILRVYEHTMVVEGPLDALEVTLADRHGVPVRGATLTSHWNPETPRDATLASILMEKQVPMSVTENRSGTYNVQPDLPPGATGELVIESRHDTGTSLARLTLLPDGSWVENRHVGLNPTGSFPGLQTRLLETDHFDV